MKYAPVSGLSLALFNVLASSSMLFLSPFNFQLPPTKNFLPVMTAKCCFHQKIIGVENTRTISDRRDGEEMNSARVYIRLANKLRPPALAIGSRQHAYENKRNFIMVDNKSISTVHYGSFFKYFFRKIT